MTGEFEPNDSRNVTGTASTEDGRWTNQGGQPLDASGQPQQQAGGMGQPGTFTGGSGGQAGTSQAAFSDEGMAENDPSAMGQSAESGWAGDAASGRDSAGPQDGASAFAFGDQIREHMTVIDAQGTTIGTVDGLEDGRIKLTRSNSDDGQHHYVALDAVEAVDGDQVRLSGSHQSDFAMNGE